MAAAVVARAPALLPASLAAPSAALAASCFSVDLAASAHAQRRLLLAAHAVPRGALYEDGPVLREAVRRYPLFLALVDVWGREGGGAPLALPLDAAWLWHCHKLAPLDYGTDCQERFGHLIDVPKGSEPYAFEAWAAQGDDDAALSPTAAAWARLFPSEPFHLAPPAEGAEPAAAPAFACDLVAAAGRQKGFLWQVSGAQYGNESFLAEAAARYAQLLVLMSQRPKAFLVPTYDMDIMWHAHMAWPGAYAADTMALCGRVISHDDSVNNRETGGKLETSTAFTAAAWSETFPGESWAKRGGMYCGEPPAWYHAAEPRWRGGMPCAEGLSPLPPAPGYGAPPGQQAPMQQAIPGLVPLPPAGQAGYPPQQPQYGAPPPQYGAPPPQYGAPPPQYGAPPPQYPQKPQYAPPPPQYAPQQPQYAQQPQQVFVSPMAVQQQPMQMAQTGPFLMLPNGQPQMMMVTEDTGCCCCPDTATRAVPVRNPMYAGGGGYGGGQYNNGGMMMGGGGYGGGGMGGGGMSGGTGLALGLVGGGLLGMAVAESFDNDGGGCGGGGGNCGGGGCGGGGCGGGDN